MHNEVLLCYPSHNSAACPGRARLLRGGTAPVWLLLQLVWQELPQVMLICVLEIALTAQRTRTVSGFQLSL